MRIACFVCGASIKKLNYRRGEVVGALCEEGHRLRVEQDPRVRVQIHSTSEPRHDTRIVFVDSSTGQVVA